ncbi:MAG: amino acid adenylation domain-containing protein [Chitinophagaceae bacterium]
MNEIISFFHELSLHSGAIWLENETIKLSTPKELQNENTRHFIVNNKSSIISILSDNNIFSKDEFLHTVIFKDSTSPLFPLSPAQERLWFIEQYEEGSNAYHIPAMYELDADTDAAGIQYALQQIVSRHEVLRSTIETGANNAQAVQRVHHAPLQIEQATVSAMEDFEPLLQKDINRPFDLSIQYPIRAKFYRFAHGIESLNGHAGKTVLLINTHHIASDGWSAEIFERELFLFYEAYSSNKTDFHLPALEIQYKDYAAWQRTYLTGAVMEKQLRYWKDKLSGYQTLELPTDYPRPARIDYCGCSQGFTIDETTSLQLRTLAQRYGVTVHSVMLSSFTILLGKYTGQNDIVTGSVNANRQHRQTESLIGFFVNTLASRTLLSPSQSFADLIQQVHQAQEEAQLYQDLPFEKLVEELGVERDPSRHPVFQVMFGVHETGIQEKATDQQKNYLLPFQADDAYEIEKFDLSVFIYDGQDELMGHISYATALFHSDSVSRLIGHYKILLKQLAKAPQQPYSEHSLLTPEAYEQLVYAWNDTDIFFPKDKMVQQLFQQQAAKAPGSIALQYETQQLTYRQLNEKSNQLARYIRQQYQQRTKQVLKPGTLVALCMPRGLDAVTGIMGILKSGAAYVPIDPSYPQERIDYQLNDSGAALVLTLDYDKINNPVRLPAEKIIDLSLDAGYYADEDCSDLAQLAMPSDLAYLIYTSGTTGKPKAVMIAQENLVNLVFGQQAALHITDQSTVLQYASLVFDASVWEIFSALSAGARLCIVPPAIRQDAQLLCNYMAEKKITLALLPPVLLHTMPNAPLPDLRTLLVGGDVSNTETLNKWSRNRLLINAYGPTEITVIASMHIYQAGNKNTCIGKPVANSKLYVLDKFAVPVPIGITGELFIGGAGVAGGYLHQAAITDERFIANPFATAADKVKGYARLYRTGDLVRWLPEGNLEYIGRNDEQVKIRGFRIEPGEIEQALLQIPGISQSCVLVKERPTAAGTTKYLVAYYVPEDNKESISPKSITETLSQLLPEYMVPGILVAMNALPFTINGKLDKKSLPDPDFTATGETYTAPTTDTEATLCRIWQDVLGIDRVGITDNFFRIGGNSILAIQVSHGMSRALQYDIKVAEVFTHKTISGLLLHGKRNSQTNIPVLHTNTSILSFAQERLWFIEQYEQGSTAYHVPMVMELDADTDIAGAKYALQQIVARHEVLRTTIEQTFMEEHGIQHVHNEPLLIKEINVKIDEDIKTLIEQDLDRPFDLSAEYPLRVSFFYTPSTGQTSGKTVLLIIFHHIASDGWSLNLFQKEWAAYYEAYRNNDLHFALPQLEIQYKDYAAWQRTYLSGAVLEKQLGYWKNKLSGYQVLELPTDYARPAEIDYSGASISFTLSPGTSQQLRSMAQHYGVTLHAVMLTSFHILLGKYTGQEDTVTGSVSANRHHRQTETLIGFFINTQVNRILLNSAQSFEDLVQQVHQELVQAHLYQDLPFEKLVVELGVERDPSRHPIFQVMFGIESTGNPQQEESEPTAGDDSLQSQIAYRAEKFDLSVTIEDSQPALTAHVSYATALFKHDSITRLISHYTCLLVQLVEAPALPYSRHSLLSTQEYDQLVYEWNATDKAYPKETTLYQVFQEQAANTPDNMALVFEGQSLSYRQLNEKSNQLARHIRQQYLLKTNRALAPDTLIALYLDRSPEMIIGILAVLKAGGAYVPMDINYPQERLNYLLEDTAAELILTQRHLNREADAQLPAGKIIYTDLAENCYISEDPSNLPAHSNATDLAYLIYTSGSTGKPKAVAIEHASVVNMAISRVSEYNMTADENSLQIASVCFDASVEQIFVALFCGARLTLIKKEILIDGEQCERFLNENKITHLDTVPSFLETLDFSKLTSLQRIASGGEACTVELVNRILPYINFYNEYGPTEATVITTQYRIARGQKITEQIPIGKPIDNAKIFILDSSLGIVPAGIVGEIYIGGDCLARGYLNSAALTAEKFIENPFGAGRLYKTGDLGRWRSDGEIEYKERKDNQVKIRGFRIETGEIEHALSQVPGIGQCYVLAKERNTAAGSVKYLAAYYAPEKGVETIATNVIIEQLSTSLPDYMLPDALIAMESFPLSITGKLDREALPEPNFTDGDNHIKPGTDLEIRLCHVYASVLGLPFDQISTHQNFFRMGGNSILSIRLKIKLNQLEEFRHTSVADLFRYNSINKLIQSIQANGKADYKLSGNILQNNDHEVAIIAVSGAFSGATDVGALWDIISQQLEGICFYNKEECIEMGIDADLFDDPSFIPVEGKVDDIALFDPAFWEMSPNEARQLDPQIRKFVEHCWFALESSGYAPNRTDHNIGVFAGSGYSSYFYDHILHGEMADQIDIWEASISNDKDSLPTKTAYLLGLTGPANAINTACSTGLVSVIEACKNLRLGTCNMALAGGVSLSMSEQAGYMYEEGMILSKDGHCKTFDKDSSGTTGGSGVGVVLLKRLRDAVKDNDPILAVIKGYATNNDGGRKAGYTAPSLIGQAECIINAQSMAGINVNQIDYVECHGTATHLGDPIEVQALKEAFQYQQTAINTPGHKIVLGAVKANIGHTDSAAGTASLIKVIAMLQHGIIPGQANFNEPNPELQLHQTNFEIIKENRDWPASKNRQRLAGVSSFGIGGTNAHVVIADYLPNHGVNMKDTGSPYPSSPDKSVNYIIPLSAKSRQSLEKYRAALLTFLSNARDLNEPLSLRDIAFTLSERREHFTIRTAYCASSIDELICQLEGDAQQAATITGTKNSIVFMFPGQGAQYTHMAKELYDNEIVFKTTVDRCLLLAGQYSSVDLFDVLYPLQEYGLYNINDTQWAPVCLFIIEYAMAEYVSHLGVKADAFTGHSFGEYVAAVLCGVFSLADAIKLLIERGKLMQAMPPGSMLAVNATEVAVRSLAEKYDCEISLINSPDDVVVSGTPMNITALQQVFERQEIPVVKLNASVAGHSKLMEQAAIEFETVFNGITLSKPRKPFISNVTGDIAGEEVTTPAYWCKQLRNTVQFARGISNLSGRYNHQITFIELGAGKGLCYFVNKFKTKHRYQSIQTVQLLPSAREAKSIDDAQVFQKITTRQDMKARLWMHGIIKQANDPALFSKAALQTNLPCYQFNFQECWLEKAIPQEIKKFNSLDEILYERSWERMRALPPVTNNENVKYLHALVLVTNADAYQSETSLLLADLNNIFATVSCVVHEQQSSNDLSDASHMSAILTGRSKVSHIDLVIYISPSIDTCNPALDVFAVRNIFTWLKDTGHELKKFISISFDNYEVTGNEIMQEIPSVIYGVTKSIPFEYFTSRTKAFHLDFSAQDTQYKNVMLAVLEQNEERDLFVIRGKYQWFPTYRQLTSSGNRINTGNGAHAGKHAFLITGGLGGVGYAWADYLVQKEVACTIVLTGRSKESNLREDYKNRLAILRESGHTIIYAPIDIGHAEALASLEKLLGDNHINVLDTVLHAAGIAAKSALMEKTRYDIEQVVNPKIKGIDTLIRLARNTPINNLVACSSLTSITPALGNMEYTLANLYLDEISNRRHTGIKYMITVNLNQVSDTGMAVDFINNSTSGEGWSADAIKSYEFPVITAQLLKDKNINNIALSRYDLNTAYLENARLFDHLNQSSTDTIRSADIKIAEDNYTAMEYQIARIFGEALGIEEISVHDDFFRLGGNSIHAIHVSHRISKALQCDVFVADLFKQKTISNISDFLLSKNNTNTVTGKEIEI